MNNSVETLSVDQLVGQVIGGCQIERLLGRGRLSAVYLAQQPVQKRPVAITAFIIPAQFSEQAHQRFIGRFAHEAAALALLDHPHILPVYAYGEQFGYPYLITPYVTSGSLADSIKQQGRCTPEYTLEVLKQMTSALDYAHNKGVVHGTLKPSNILLSGQSGVQIAGFGLVRMLEMRGIEQNSHAYSHLLSVAGTFLGTPEYVAPEFVEGKNVDVRSDVYALGTMLFELLSGKHPFTGTNPIEVAMQHVKQPLPSLLALRSDLPAALESVIFQALERDPNLRFQRVGELASAFERALKGPVAQGRQQLAADLAAGGAFREFATGQWQLMPPVATGQVPSVTNAPSETVGTMAAKNTGAWQLVPPIVTGSLPAFHPPAPTSPQVPAGEQPVPLVRVRPQTGALPVPPRELDDVAIDPFDFWSRTFSGQLEAQVPTPPLTDPRLAVGSLPSAANSPSRRPQAKKMRRRRVVALLAGGGLVAAGVVGVGGISLAHMLGNMVSHPQTAMNPAGTTGGTATHPPAHMGTVVGATNQARNTSKGFTNPKDGQGSLLIHLPNGTFVAYEKACTHQGVAVYYDGKSHLLVCPAHGAIFDPANGGNVVQGPANRPLPKVAIRVNADGTITTG